VNRQSRINRPPGRVGDPDDVSQGAAAETGRTIELTPLTRSGD